MPESDLIANPGGIISETIGNTALTVLSLKQHVGN